MKPTLLIVDDLAWIRSELKQELQKDFDIVGEGEDGVRAVELVRQFHPQLVVMDVVMPRMSGIEAVRQIHREPSVPKPKIVIVSGLKDENVVLQALEAGANEYLFKPVNFEQLRKVLFGFLNTSGQSSESH